MNFYGKLIYKGRVIEAGIEVENGIVKNISKRIRGKKLRGLIMPAGIDVHVHFRDFNEKHKETIESGSLSALNGGICLVVDQPNTDPPIENKESYIKRVEIAGKKSYVDYSLNLALTKRNVGEIRDIYCSISNFNPRIGEIFLYNTNKNLQVEYEDIARVKDLRITIHAEDPLFIHGDENTIPNFKYREKKAEVIAVKRLAEIGNFHFCHISTKEAFCILKETDSSIEVTPHHLLLSKEDYERLGNFVNVNPPLRDREDKHFLLENFKEIDIVASDHAPHTKEEKLEGYAGFPGVETMYPLLMALAFKGIINVFDLAEKIAEKPAEVFGFKRYGEIDIGNYANFAVFNFSALEKIKSEKLNSLCGWTPFDRFDAIFPHVVIIRGEIFKDGEILATPGDGMVYENMVYENVVCENSENNK